MAGRGACLCLLVVGCATTGTPSSTTEPAVAGRPPPLHIVPKEFGQQNSTRSEDMTVPFGVNQNGTELILVLLQRAHNAGAAYVGDLQIATTFRWNGTAVECRSKVVFSDDPAAAPPPPAAAEAEQGQYSTAVQEFRPRRVTAEADETELVCVEGVQMVVAGKASTITDRDDVERKHNVEYTPKALDVDVKLAPETYDRCHRERVKRKVERYDYEVKLGYVPPNWEYISKRYAEGKLVTTAPVCYQVSKLEEPIYRLTAKAFYRSVVASEPETRRPSDDVLENMLRPETRSEEAAKQRCGMMGGKDDMCERMGFDDPGWVGKTTGGHR